MNQSSPFFSVVIPTRSRAQLLRHALKSALDQTFDDYEVVVSDNCSQDNTPEVVKELGTAKVRYVRSDLPLSMPENWNFGLNHAQGEYITYLCDDDALCPRALERAHEVITRCGSNLVMLGSASYYGSNWLDTTYRNSVRLSTYTGREIECDSRETLHGLFTCQINLNKNPLTLNSVCRREIFHKVRKKAQGIFFLCPDYSSSALTLTEVPEWIHIDEPLRLQGIFAEGIGSTVVYNRGEPFREFVREFNRDDLLTRVPLKAPVVTNYIAETLLTAKEKLPSKFAGIEIDWVQYFIGCWINLLTHENAGVRVETDKEEFFHVLARYPKEIESHVRTAVARYTTQSHPLKRAVRGIINSVPLFTQLESTIRPNIKSVRPVVIHGNKAGFTNICECARQLPYLAAN